MYLCIYNKYQIDSWLKMNRTLVPIPTQSNLLPQLPIFQITLSSAELLLAIFPLPDAYLNVHMYICPSCNLW